jgi:Reverse transcriptase (RNA-dependent DNA polymerase)
MSFKVLRQIFSISVEKNWRLGSLDVKAAYLQATGFNREIYVRPPVEEHDASHVWQLEKQAYGLARLWFLTSFRALIVRGLRPCPYDETAFASDDYSLIVTVQVDNFIYTGTAASMDNFEEFMKTRFQLSELKLTNLPFLAQLSAEITKGLP